MTPRYISNVKWYKGNTHIHSTRSDGGKSVEELQRMYRQAGYDFIAITDHGKSYRSESCPSDSGFLTLGGIEVDGTPLGGRYCHVVAIGACIDILPAGTFEQTMHDLAKQKAMVILAHPYWCGNDIGDVQRFPFDAIEIYNHVCDWLNGKGSSLMLWDQVLASGDSVFGIAADDAHIVPRHPGWNGGWVMVQANALTAEAIVDSLKAGRFYATCGPSFHSIDFDGDTITCTTSPIQQARLVGAGYLGERIWREDGTVMESFSFKVSDNPRLASSAYLRVEIEDADHRRAWTNPLW